MKKRWLILVLLLGGCDVSWHHIEWAERVCKDFGGVRYVNEWHDTAECVDGAVIQRPHERRH